MCGCGVILFQSEIHRVKLDGSNHSSFPPGGSVNSPSCLAVDRVSRYLYWGSQSSSTIAVISLDGPMHYRHAILTSSNSTVASPVDIAVDPIHGFVLLLLLLRRLTLTFDLSTPKPYRF